MRQGLANPELYITIWITPEDGNPIAAIRAGDEGEMVSTA